MARRKLTNNNKTLPALPEVPMAPVVEEPAINAKLELPEVPMAPTKEKPIVKALTAEDLAPKRMASADLVKSGTTTNSTSSGNNADNDKSKVVKETSEKIRESQQGGGVPRSAEELLRILDPRTPDAQKEAENKRLRRNSIIAAISDGLAALSNLYFTTKGAPNARFASLSKQNADRRDALLAQWQAEKDKYDDLVLKLYGLGQDEAQRLWEREFKQREFREAQRKNDADIDLTNARADEVRANADEVAARAEGQRIKNKHLPEQIKAELDNLHKKGELFDAQRRAADRSNREKKNTIILDTGNYGFAEVPTNAINEQTVGAMISMLPESVQNSIRNGHGYGDTKKAYSLEETLTVIGQYAGVTPRLQKYIEDLATENGGTVRKTSGRKNFNLD